MSQPRAEAINELIEHEIAFQQMVFVVGNFFGQGFQKFGLDAAERFRGLLTRFRQLWVRLLPFLQLVGKLLIVRRVLLDQFFHQPVLLLLA